MLARAAFASAAVLAVGCGADSGRERFESAVVPVLERHCLSQVCHGVGPDAEARGEVIDWDHFFVRVDADGRIADVDQAYERARSRINVVEHGALSSLVRKPLAPEAGGTLHVGGASFSSLEHPDARALLAWIALETSGGEGASADSLTALERQFAADVLPRLTSRQCLNQACHGEAAPFTSFRAPMVIDGAPVMSIADVRANYAAARAHLSPGEPGLSRLARKGLPLHAGGIVHRGGNGIFFGAADAEAIAGWADAERAAAMSTDGVPRATGIVFVRGPVGAQEPFEPDAFAPGTDLWVLAPASADGIARNLTAGAHPAGPADVRDPTVRHDAAAIAFSMRTGLDDAHNIYEIGVDGAGLRQLTFDRAAHPGGGVVANVQPTYGPDGRIYFASTRAGTLADGGDEVDTEIWAVAPDTGQLDRITYDPQPAVTPSFVGTGKTYGTLAFTLRRVLGGRYEGPVFRMPLDHNKAFHPDPELHIHHGVTLAGQIVYAMRTMHDGRFACVLVDRDSQWRGGQLAVFDRQLGPEIPRGFEDEATVGGFRHAFSPVDDSTASGGGLYRHPVPLPDGSLLVTYAAGPIDPRDPSAPPDLGVYVVELEETPDGPVLAARLPLVDEPGVADYDAEPIAPRPLEDDPSHPAAWDESRATTHGRLAFRHVRTLEALFGNLEQRGPKPFRDDLAFARLVEWVPVTPDQAAASPTGIGPHGRARVLAEVPLAGDSLFLEVPADRPFRVQMLDADRMAVGAQHNRWIQVAPGETFPGGVSPALFPVLCAGCHGASSGNAADVGGPVPDAVSAASITLATHENLDPRRPLSPVRVGDGAFGVDFAVDVGPLVARSCAVAGCHDADAAAGGLDLDARAMGAFDTAYLALAPYVDLVGTSARRSPLLERLLGRELDAPGTVDGACPGDPPLSDDEVLTVVRWLDLGAPYRGGAP